jgi:hypothetical protein
MQPARGRARAATVSGDVWGRWSAAGAIAGLWWLLGALPAWAQAPQVVGPYNGAIPFECELQNVGTGTDFPDPGADPFCVEFDKTNQNLTDFGLVEFTAQEPARVAAAAAKCFYFQRDHWTGSVVQGQSPELWHWDGDYFYDRARGVGGVSVRNFRIAGTPQDATPYVPAAYRPYFDEGGGGGVEVLLETDPDPACAARVDTPEERDGVYGGRGLYPACIPPGGKLRGRHVGRVRLGMRRDRVLTRLGPPRRARRHIDRWCLVGKGELRVAYSHRRVGAILSSGRGHSYRGVSRGDRMKRARKRLEIAGRRRLPGGTKLLVLGHTGNRRVWIGAHHRRVRWVMIHEHGLRAERALRFTSGVR